MPGSDSLSILDGSTFVVSDRRGDIEARADQPHGLFYRDTRFLSRWRLSLDDQPLEALSTDDVDYFAAQSSWSGRRAPSTRTRACRSSASASSATASTRTWC